MERKFKFKEGELILVDVSPEEGKERWIPGIYLFELPTGNHAVKITEDGEQVERAYSALCLKHSDQALTLKVHYEVYADTYGSSASVFASLMSAERAAWDLIYGPKPSPTFEVRETIIVDKVLVGGYPKVAMFYPKGDPREAQNKDYEPR